MFVLIFVLFMYSCSQKDPEDKSSADDAETITWWCSNRAAPFGLSMGDLPVFKELQERTGARIEFIHPPAGQYALRFKLMLASGELPDIISHDFINDYSGGIAGALQDDIVLPIDGQLLRNAPHLKKYLDDNPETAAALKTPDGKYFCVPALNTEKRTSTYIGPFIRTDYLVKHGLTAPVTVSDWEEVLSVFHQDPSIEIPLTFYGGNIRDTRFLISSFGIDWGFFVQDGSVVYGPCEPGFRDFIVLFKKWYTKGWMDPRIMMNSRRAYNRVVRNSNVGIYVDYVSNIMNYERMLKGRDPAAELVPIEYPRINESAPRPPGHETGVFIPFAAAYITPGAGDPEKVIRMLDYAWSEEGRILFNFGIEGESYFIKDGKPFFKDEIFKTEGIGNLKYYIVSGPYLKNPDSFLQILRLNTQKEAVQLWIGEQLNTERLPLLIPDKNENIKLMNIKSRLDSYVFDTAVDIISGKKELEDLEQLNADLMHMGLDEALVLYNTLYKNIKVPRN